MRISWSLFKSAGYILFEEFCVALMSAEHALAFQLNKSRNQHGIDASAVDATGRRVLLQMKFRSGALRASTLRKDLAEMLRAQQNIARIFFLTTVPQDAELAAKIQSASPLCELLFREDIEALAARHPEVEDEFIERHLSRQTPTLRVPTLATLLKKTRLSPTALTERCNLRQRRPRRTVPRREKRISMVFPSNESVTDSVSTESGCSRGRANLSKHVFSTAAISTRARER